jgi:Ca-activated chloride channel homolog
MNHWFAHLWLLWGLALLPLLGCLSLWSRLRRRRALARLGTRVALLDALPRPRGWGMMRGSSLLMALTLLGLGMAGPQWGRDWEQSAAPGRDLMIVVDCSRSMLAEVPSRLDRARTALVDLAQTLQKRGGHRVGLVVFAGRARLLCPLTHDYDHFRSTLEDLGTLPFDPELGPSSSEDSGTRIGLGLHEAITAHDIRFAGARDMILLSDGDDPARDGEYRYGIDEAREQGIPIHVIGLGNPDEASPIRIDGRPLLYEGKEVSTRLEEAPLREIAERTRGTYTAARTASLSLGKLYLDLVAGESQREQSDDALPVYRQHYLQFLMPAFVLLFMNMLLPDRLTWRAGGVGPRRQAAEARQKRTPTMTKPLSSPLALLLPLLTGLLLAASPSRGVEGYLREGNAAFQRGDYAAAITLYEKAETISTDPAQVAFNLAVSRYCLAQEKNEERSTGFREAEVLFRCCLDKGDPRRARAWYGLGLCLLNKAASREELNQAFDCFERCLQSAGTGEEMRMAARQGRELARLRLSQFQAPQARDSDNTPNQESSKPEKQQRRPQLGQEGDGGQQGMDKGGTKTGRVQVKPERGQNPQASQEPPPPGEGNLPPVPDRADLPPLSPQDAAGHLDQASQRILEEERAYRQRKARPSLKGVRDW